MATLQLNTERRYVLVVRRRTVHRVIVLCHMVLSSLQSSLREMIILHEYLFMQFYSIRTMPIQYLGILFLVIILGKFIKNNVYPLLGTMYPGVSMYQVFSDKMLMFWCLLNVIRGAFNWFNQTMLWLVSFKVIYQQPHESNSWWSLEHHQWYSHYHHYIMH